HLPQRRRSHRPTASRFISAVRTSSPSYPASNALVSRPVRILTRRCIMKAFSLAILQAAACLALAVTSLSAAGADQEDLEGVWVATSMEINGERAPAKEVERTRFTFKGEKLLVRHAKDEGKEEKATFKADPKKSPRHLDITLRNKTLHGIYEVKGDELKF